MPHACMSPGCPRMNAGGGEEKEEEGRGRQRGREEDRGRQGRTGEDTGGDALMGRGTSSAGSRMASTRSA